MSKTYFVTYFDEGDTQIEIHETLTEVKKSLTHCFKRNNENIVVYEARAMDINIDISISTKKELPF